MSNGTMAVRDFRQLWGSLFWLDNRTTRHRGRWLSPMRFFAEEGGEGAAGGAGVATVAAAAGTAEGGEPEKPWFNDIEGLDDDDKKILKKYKSRDDAIKSIKHREKRLGEKIDFPGDDVEPEDRKKQHRLILRRMGLPEKANGYQEVAKKLLDGLAPNVRKSVTDEAIQQTYEKAHELGLLPWQYETMLAERLTQKVEELGSKEDEQVAAQNKLEKAMKLRYRLQHADHTTNAELMAAHLDEFVRANPLGLEGEDGKIAKDTVSQLLKGQNNPVLYAIFDHLHDLILSEGDGLGTRRFGAEANDVYSNAYKQAQINWPNRGEEYWKSYAHDVARGA